MLSLSLCPAESPNELSLPSLPTRLASNALCPSRAFWASTCIALAEGEPPLSLGSPLSCAWLPYTLLSPVMCRPGFLLIFIWKRGLLGKLSLRPLPQVTDWSPVYLPGSIRHHPVQLTQGWAALLALQGKEGAWGPEILGSQPHPACRGRTVPLAPE